MNKVILLISFLLLQKIVVAENKDIFSIGISAEETILPTIRAKVKIIKNFSTEIRIGTASTEKVSGDAPLFQNWIVGLRSYYYPYVEKKTNRVYFGLEIDYISSHFFASPVFATGYALGGYAGVEKYFSRKISIAIDVGSYYLELKQKKFNIYESGVDIIINCLLNFYFL